MTLYTRSAPGQFVEMSAENEAAARANPDSMISQDSGHEVLLPSAEAAAIRAMWAANDPTLNLGAAKAAKLRSAGAHFAGLFVMPNGFTYSAKLYQIDYPDSQDAITAMGALAGAALSGHGTWDPAFYFIAADNSHVAMDAPAMFGFANAVADYVRNARYRYRAIKDATLAAADISSVNAIDETSGYPTPSA